LLGQTWPGNVRQLQNALEYAVAMCDDAILPCHFPQHMSGTANNSSESVKKQASVQRDGQKCEGLSQNVMILESQMIKDALEKAGYNKTKAMEMLRISRKTFYKKLKEYGLMPGQSDAKIPFEHRVDISGQNTWRQNY